MAKRTLLIGDYDTAANGWTLTGWKLSAAEMKSHLVDKTGGDGSFDMTTALTDGIVRYKDRTFTATLECSEGDRLARRDLIRQMVLQLDGQQLQIVLPDDADKYLEGRAQVAVNYNDPAHASVTVTAVCRPWLLRKTTESVSYTLTGTVKAHQFNNPGQRVAVPEIKVTAGSDGIAEVNLSYTGAHRSFTAGTFIWPDLAVPPGSSSLAMSGKGRITISYRPGWLE